jgi:uncharacterized membrane protein
MKSRTSHTDPSSKNDRALWSGRFSLSSLRGPGSDLFLRILLSTTATIAIIVLYRAMGMGQSSILRILFGILFIGFLPGDAFLIAMFPQREILSALERFVLTILISLIIIALIGFFLDYTVLGITLESLLFATDTIIIACYAISFIRRRAIMSEGKKTDTETLKPAEAVHSPVLTRKTIISLLASIIGSLALILLIGLTGPTEKYTEFFLLDSQYQLGIGRNRYALGESLPLNFVVINHEGKTELYHLLLIDNHNAIMHIASVQLGDRQQWNQPFQLDLTELGDNKIFRFVLYREGDNEPYRSLQIVITVSESKPTSP